MARSHPVARQRHWLLLAQLGLILGGLIAVLVVRQSGAAPDVASFAAGPTSTTPNTSLAPVSPGSSAPSTSSPATSAPLVAPAPPPTIGPTDVEPGTFDLSTALDAVAAAAGGRVAITIQVGELSTHVEIAADDNGNRSLDYGEGGATIIVAESEGLIYVPTSLFPGTGSDAEWLAFESEPEETGPLRTDDMAVIEDHGPTAMGLVDAGQGQQKMLYRTLLSRAQIESISTPLPFVPFDDGVTELVQVVFDIFVSEDNTVGRVVTTSDSPDARFTATFDLISLEPVEIELPDPATVERVDEADLAGVDDLVEGCPTPRPQGLRSRSLQQHVPATKPICG